MGKLSIVATPIGNLEDISLRALRVLKEADRVLCEDTRQTRVLLDHYGIKTPTSSYHQHTSAPKSDKLIAWLRAGQSLALVTDAGTPGISDPGGRLVRQVREELGPAVAIECIPGPSALTAALSLAGDGYDRFLFLGFLPHKKGRQAWLQAIGESEQPVVVYESKHRIQRLLRELAALEEQAGAFLVQVARELTKMHESFYEGQPAEIAAALEMKPASLKGEFVVLIRKK